MVLRVPGAGDFCISEAQVALAWLLAQKPWIVPIPGTTKLERLEENLGSVDLTFSAVELSELDLAASKIQLQGERYPAEQQTARRSVSEP